jgi:hypothetical protein
MPKGTTMIGYPARAARPAPAPAAEKQIFPMILLEARAIRLHVHFVGDIEARLTVLNGARLRVGEVPRSKLGQCLHRR